MPVTERDRPCPQCGAWVMPTQRTLMNGNAYKNRCLTPLKRECFYQTLVSVKPEPKGAA